MGLYVCGLGQPGRAADGPSVAVHRDSFDSDKPSWRVSAEAADSARLRTHARSDRFVQSGTRSELIQLDAAQRGGRLFLEQTVPPALVFDELQATVWLRSNRPGLRVGLRIVFPRQVNPHSGEPLTVDFWGESYAVAQRWQPLRCRTTDTEIAKLLARLRNQLVPILDTADLDVQGMYVDRVILSQDIEAGAVEYSIDTLELSPLIDPASNGAEIVQVSATQEVAAPVTIGDGRLLRSGAPLFPVFTPHHGETPEELRQAGFNLVWVPQYDDQALLTQLARAGLGVMAEPPAVQVQPPDQTGDVAYSVGLPPLAEGTENILMWHLGSEVEPEALASVRAAANAVRDADRLRRPILVDVTGSIREFHRSVDIVGFSKHTIHTTSSPQDYLESLQQDGLQALRGRPTFTWVFTEPNPALLENRAVRGSLPYVEPEQIWMQVNVALSSGAKAIGYWKHTPLNQPTSDAEERRHAITIANLRLQIVQEWLATGKVTDMAPVHLGTARTPGQPGFTQTLLTPFNRLASNNAPADALDANVKAPVIRSEAGLLILPQWLEPNAQYQPGAMAAQDVRIFLRGIRAVHAWEVTTTSVYPHELKVEDTSGGTEITLQRLDQSSIIIVPTDLSAIDRLRERMHQVRAQAAQSWVALAQLKLDRVQAVHDDLQQLTPENDVSEDQTLKYGDSILAEARRQARTAAAHLQAGKFDDARVASENVLRLTRQIQRAHWENIVRPLSSPVSTPYTICFQTLPDFWRLMQTIGRSRGSSENLLHGGDFSNWDTIFAAGWKYDAVPAGSEIVPIIELHGDGASGRCLRLAAHLGDSGQASPDFDRPPVKFVTHPMPVYSGQIVHIRGKVKIEVPVSGSTDGALFYDNLVGSIGALRFNTRKPTGNWVPFELIRPVQHSGELQLTLELTGYGDVRFDELQVTVDTPQE
ncbi:MAG: hypothetical protein KDA75_12330 [Planctomycetaceae bacterium]|nr:hypothetical protein [Planctomycetaceae bacterium]